MDTNSYLVLFQLVADMVAGVVIGILVTLASVAFHRS